MLMVNFQYVLYLRVCKRVCACTRVRAGIKPNVERPLVVHVVNIHTKEVSDREQNPKKSQRFQFSDMISNRKHTKETVLMRAWI